MQSETKMSSTFISNGVRVKIEMRKRLWRDRMILFDRCEFTLLSCKVRPICRAPLSPMELDPKFSSVSVYEEIE